VTDAGDEPSTQSPKRGSHDHSQPSRVIDSSTEQIGTIARTTCYDVVVGGRLVGRVCACALLASALACGRTAPLSETGASSSETTTGRSSTETTDGCPHAPCSRLGWGCAGPSFDGCCDGLPCEPAFEDGTNWTCGGVVASGVEASCDVLEGCEWIELGSCESYGPIEQACGEGFRVAKLRRCDQSCFAPDERYVTHWLCACASNEPACADVECPCEGATWDAMLCCG
jgi:hypothetical protein